MKKIIYTFATILLPLLSIGQTWNGSTDTDWQTPANWDEGVIPTSSGNVLIPNNLSNYPIIIGETPAECNSLTIQSVASITIASNGSLTVNGTLTNNAANAGLIIESDATGTGSLINSTSGVNATVNLFLSGEQWHYISTPINGVDYTEFNTLNFKFWDATMAWLGGQNTDPWLTYSGTLVNGQGYANYESENTTTLTGELNQGIYSINVSMNSTGILQNDGWNLVGNPYSSAIDWDNVKLSNVNIDDAIYLYDGLTETYKSYVNGVGSATQYIPQGQGFFVKCNNTEGGTLTINDADRVHNSKSIWKETKQTSGLIRLIAQGNGLSDETLIRFIEGATEEFDGSYDAYKLFSSNPDVPQIYSLNNSKTTTFSINSLPEITEELTIPMGFLVTTPGTYSISPAEMSIDAEYVYLEDMVKDSVIDLIKYPTYIFDFNDGTANDDRFLLRIIPKTTGVYNITDNEFKIYPNPSNGIVTFESNNTKNRPLSYEIFNIKGQRILSRNYNTGKSTEILDLSYLAKGIYTVKIYFGGKSAFRKLILMK